MDESNGGNPSNSDDNSPHGVLPRTVSIGILTYKRPRALERCLTEVMKALRSPLPDNWAAIEVLVIDNDPEAGADSTVASWTALGPSGPRVRYVHEPMPGVASARNRALDDAEGDVLVFIDDDEVPNPEWPHGLLDALDETGAAMVGGPVYSDFTASPPAWITDGGFFERETPHHLSRQKWLRSGNLAIDRSQLRAVDLRFDPRYAQGEDSAFTRAARKAGLDLRWSARGAVTEFVTDDRFSLQWRLRREYLSSRTWTRSSLDLAGSGVGRMTVRGRTLAVAGARAVQGLTGLAQSVVRWNRAGRVKSLVHVAGAAGKVVEIVAYRRPLTGRPW